MLVPDAKIGDPVYVLTDRYDDVVSVHASIVSAKEALEAIARQYDGKVVPREKCHDESVMYYAIDADRGSTLGVVVEKPLSH